MSNYSVIYSFPKKIELRTQISDCTLLKRTETFFGLIKRWNMSHLNNLGSPRRGR
jgi:hypothetical protein